MKVRLEKAALADAAALHKMQVEAFLPLLQKYQDVETNPANDKVERIIQRLQQPFTTYFFIVVDDVRVGAIRRVYQAEERHARISPIFILPAHQGKGYGQAAIALLEEITDAKTWQLNTILQEQGNCYLYEKMGYKRIDPTRVVNDRMTIVSYAKKTAAP